MTSGGMPAAEPRSGKGVQGTVTFVDEHGGRFSVQTDDSGTYSIVLSPGSYKATGHSPKACSYGGTGKVQEIAAFPLDSIIVTSGATIDGVDLHIPIR